MKDSIRLLPWIGLVLTIFYIVIILLALLEREDSIWEFFLDAALNEIGDFLAGLFGPIAFLWLILGYFMQSAELRAQVREIQNQTENFKYELELKKNDYDPDLELSLSIIRDENSEIVDVLLNLTSLSDARNIIVRDISIYREKREIGSLPSISPGASKQIPYPLEIFLSQLHKRVFGAAKFDFVLRVSYSTLVGRRAQSFRFQQNLRRMKPNSRHGVNAIRLGVPYSGD